MADKNKKDDDVGGDLNMKRIALFFKENEFLVILLLIVISFILLIFIFGGSVQISEPETCGDGTFYESCSIVKPYYCDSQGFLNENASICSCSDKIDGESCITALQTGAKNINLNYIIDGEEKAIELTVYSGLVDYFPSLPSTIFYENGGKPIRADFIFKKINEEEQRKLLMPLVIKIQNLTKDKQEQARIAVSIVQNIPYGAPNKTSSFLGGSTNYSRYPYEILYDMTGACGEKSELLSFLLREIGYGTVIFHHQLENHEAVGIKCPVEYSYKKTGYCFVETTGSSIISDDSVIYAGGTRLSSEPEIILISAGASLGDDLKEYSDAKTMEKIREGKLIFFKNSKLEKLKERYGLVEEYNIG
ncbi:MAG: hypothetical protein NTW17_01360 [Candidatus Pacearchaeota archaeon]|nr:hypothetical protein [Candidatus Pacearchaeota archaeon]